MERKQIRMAAGYSQVQAAVLAGVSPNTWRLFEGAPSAVTEAKRLACESAIARMAEIARGKTAA